MSAQGHPSYSVSPSTLLSIANMNVSGANNSLSDVDNSPSGADDILSRCAGAKLTTEESARILSEILPIFFHERMQPLDPRHVSEQACARLLAEHAELQTLLEEAVEAQSCRVLWECDLLSFKTSGSALTIACFPSASSTMLRLFWMSIARRSRISRTGARICRAGRLPVRLRVETRLGAGTLLRLR
ncbi:hypothetical protein BD626DRAFT_192286 [Schizophyllum amplum]|uniref:Uncharacterized protein n=1 Tax=Schizophyllum amplum TaxID=97359 RepID=A0A550CLW7_9AGAR|nr:hypothetical protein BD626DRAFT_192286 [Auriculariopsis ampla]